jgi:hypothetical protein
MKKKLFVGLTFIALTVLLVIACKKEDDSALRVGYADEVGTGANPDNTTAASTGTTFGTTTSTSVGSTSTTGSTGTTGATTSTSGATTSSSTTSGSTTSPPPPTGNYFQVNGTTYACTVFGGTWNNSWSIIGRSAAGDSCSVSFNFQPSAGTYPQSQSLFPIANTECMVALQIGATTYLGDVGNAVITLPTASTRKVVITNMSIANLNTGGAATLNANMTTP